MENLNQGITKIDDMLDNLNSLRALVADVYSTIQDKAHSNGPKLESTILGKLKASFATIEKLEKLTDASEQFLIQAQATSTSSEWDDPTIFQHLIEDVAEPVVIQKPQAENERSSGQECQSALSIITTAIDQTSKRVTAVPRTVEGIMNDKPYSVGQLVQEWKAVRNHNGINIEALVPDPSLTDMSPSTFKFSIDNVLTAIIDMQLGNISNSIAINRISVHGYDENKAIWQDSDYLVFRRITQLMVEPLDFFAIKHPHEAVFALLDWLATYRDLFILPCVKCKKHLIFDSPTFKYLPPTVRTWKFMNLENESMIGFPFHPQCLPAS